MKKLLVYCILCKRYDIPIGDKTRHLEREHNVNVIKRSGLASLKDMIFQVATT